MRGIKKLRVLALCLGLFACGDSKVASNMPDAPANSKSLQFFGDSRDGSEIFLTLMHLASGRYPNSDVIHLGDIISNPGLSQELIIVRAMIEPYFSLDRFFVTVGNHDVNNQISLDLMISTFPSIGERGYYVQRIQGCFCVFLNSEDLSTGQTRIGDEQRAWLDQTLASQEAQDAPYRLVMIHRPLYPQNHHSEGGLADADELHQLFMARNVTAVIAGHEHSYSHIQKDSMHYIITGGAGSPLSEDGGISGYFHYVQMFENRESLDFYSIDYRGRIRDEFKIPLAGSLRTARN